MAKNKDLILAIMTAATDHKIDVDAAEVEKMTNADLTKELARVNDEIEAAAQVAASFDEDTDFTVELGTLTSKRGVEPVGAIVQAKCFHGGLESVTNLVKKGFLVKA